MQWCHPDVIMSQILNLVPVASILYYTKNHVGPSIQLYSIVKVQDYHVGNQGWPIQSGVVLWPGGSRTCYMELG